MQEVTGVVELLSGMESEQLIAVLALASMGVCVIALVVVHSILKEKK